MSGHTAQLPAVQPCSAGEARIQTIAAQHRAVYGWNDPMLAYRHLLAQRQRV